MIKIIKEGKKEFNAVCTTCGCEFSYELNEFRWEGMLEPITDTILAWAYVPNIIYKRGRK